MKLRSLVASGLLAATSLLGLGCDESSTASTTDDVVDVDHTDVEDQAIGNCWLYAEATWAESMNLSATGKPFDISQSYWTYWHWFGQIVNDGASEIETGGFFWEANDIITKRGLVAESDFIAEDTLGERSAAQARAETKMNQELSTGRLSTREARRNGKLVRQVMDEAWGLKPEVRAWMDKAFGTTGTRTFLTSASKSGTPVLRAKDFPVRYPRFNGETVDVVDAGLDQAIAEWREVDYPYWGESQRRQFQIRVQRALHARAPVVITWLVDFNALDEKPGPMQGSFSMAALKAAGKAGSQGGHMTVLEDYQVRTQDFGVLKAGVTLDPTNPDDAKKLEAALLPGSVLEFLRVKNSWGALRDPRVEGAGFPGYHDLYLDYLNGPITWCRDGEKGESCSSQATPFQEVVLPPGF